MHLRSFLGLVELKTKVASVIPFLLGTAYVLYQYKSFYILNLLLLFGSLIFIDMFTTALNNYFDWKRANKRYGYGFEHHNSIEKYNLNETTVVAVIIMLLALATGLGVLLVLRTNLLVLALGALSFLIGILYSFGPLPLSRTPLGEAFSGFFMGFVIVFLAVYVHIYDQDIVSYNFKGYDLFIHVKLPDILSIFLVSVPLICGIANIMLANNICDIEDDIANDRHTLPVFIGKRRAVLLFDLLYAAAYADIVLSVILGILPVFCLAALLTLLLVYPNLKRFNAKQSKKETFSLSVSNFLLISGAMTLSLVLVLVFRYLVK